MKKITLLLSALQFAVCYSQSWNINGNSGTSEENFIGTTDMKALIFKTNNKEVLKISPTGQMKLFHDGNTSFSVGNKYGTFEIGQSNCNGCYGGTPGDVMLRNLGKTHNMLLYIPDNLNDGSSYIGFGDDFNKIWIKILNNRTAKFDGKIYAREIEIKANVWADFVFKPNYKLLPLNELEKYILDNRHLPEIPSEQEVMKNGINLAEISAKLLQKIEELTLYTIELNKQNKELTERIEKLEKQK